MNACLTPEYQVTISDREYSQQTDDRTVVQCNFCEMEIEKIINKGEDDEYVKKMNIPTELKYSKIKFFNLLVPPMEKLLTRNKTVKAWECPECHKVNRLSDTVIIDEEVQFPYYRKVVPTSPIRTSGLSTRLGFHEKFTKWFFQFSEELEHQLSLYRIEYVSQNDRDMADTGFLDKGDEK